MFCPKCGNEVGVEAAFCSKCGKTLSGMGSAKRGPSNWMIAVAAIAAVAAIGLATRSFFWEKMPAADTRAAAQLATPQPSPVASLAASPLPSISPGPEIEITPGDYQTYRNERFDFSILYPSNFLTERMLSQDGAGQQFKSKDGRVEMRAYGAYNSLEKSLAEMYEEEWKPNRTITYDVRKKKWFVVSGYEGGKVFYQKTMLKDDVIKTLYIEADRSLQPIIQPMTEKIARSFK